MDLVLTNRRVVVTGASMGLGREIAQRCLAAGADVAICARTARDVEATIAALRAEFPDRRVIGGVCDVASSADIDRMFDAAIDAFGTFDAVVNNAGVHGPIGKLGEIDWAEWQHAIAVNLFGSAYCCRRAVQHFKQRSTARGRAKIVNLSGGGATAPQPGLSAYAASKAALVRFTETLAEEVRASGIDVNAVAPGALATRLMTELSAAGPERIGADYHARVEDMLTKGGMSMTRAADLCVYLVSPMSDGVSGRLISAAWDPWPFSPDRAQQLRTSDIYTLRRITERDRGLDWGDQ